jgi:hypothetical protein
MSDLKFYAEVILTFDQGFTTVKGANIDALYKKYNAKFEPADLYKSLIEKGLNRYISDVQLHTSTFKKTHVAQSLVVALSTVGDDEIITRNLTGAQRERLASISGLRIGFEALDESVREPGNFPQLAPFIEACSKKTNVAEAKFLRYAYLKSAIAGKS